MLQNEYREEKENSSFIIDLGHTAGYKSSKDNKKKSIAHIFSNFNFDLGLDKFIKSKFEVSLEKTTNDTYLKVFESNLIDIDKKIKPASQSQLTSNLKLDLQGYGQPKVATEQNLIGLADQFSSSAKIAEKCGFDGVEIHAAHGYLLSSSLSPRINNRSDKCGGSVTNRTRLLQLI